MRVLFCILAGGKSSRFNSDKRKAHLLGKELLDYPIESVELLGYRPIVSLRFNDDLKTDYPIVKDPLPFLGPLCGMLEVMKQNKADFYIFLTSDMPFITGKMLKMMIDNLSVQFDAVAFNCDGVRLFPLALSQKTERLIKNTGCKNRSIKSFIEKLNIKYIDWHNCTDFFNINTKEDLKKAEGYLLSKAE
ncbi:molybdenum cofactor guanylyltransferase [Hippea maritima]|uniref:MobA-like NTP transferase domain-containing protein n=1 Tax=Hippea maritima (strain ATCC 700847 / DSM 10411 / MH2) TaxID=760142 RepID=F2LVK0_HIPMA|nr:molybdenum cofactor guanylyltransferase [Hippea maritima]AEA33784.1 hypothetical protein Hipma_0814 [Hippea maritima DSM 10411]